MERHVRATQEVNLDHHLPVTDKHLARYHFGDAFERNLVPPFDASCLHVAYVSADETRRGGCQTGLPAVEAWRV